MKKILLFTLILFVTSMSYAQKDSIGVYYETEGVLNKIEPIIYSKTKTNTLGSALTMGIASSSIKQVFSKPTSDNKVSNNPIFYFYFNHNIPVALVSKYYVFYASNNPNDIILSKFNVKKKERELLIGKVNIYAGSEIGTTDNLEATILYEEIYKGVFKVWFKDQLEDGEYCFSYNGPNGSGSFMYVFDFSVGSKNVNKPKKRGDMYF